MKHTLMCKHCDDELGGGTRKRAYLRLLIHLRFVHPSTEQPPFIRTLWGLWRWNGGGQ